MNRWTIFPFEFSTETLKIKNRNLREFSSTLHSKLTVFCSEPQNFLSLAAVFVETERWSRNDETIENPKIKSSMNRTWILLILCRQPGPQIHNTEYWFVGYSHIPYHGIPFAVKLSFSPQSFTCKSEGQNVKTEAKFTVYENRISGTKYG
jgi:hypothetical protein